MKRGRGEIKDLSGSSKAGRKGEQRDRASSVPDVTRFQKETGHW